MISDYSTRNLVTEKDTKDEPLSLDYPNLKILIATITLCAEVTNNSRMNTTFFSGQFFCPLASNLHLLLCDDRYGITQL